MSALVYKRLQKQSPLKMDRKIADAMINIERERPKDHPPTRYQRFCRLLL